MHTEFHLYKLKRPYTEDNTLWIVGTCIEGKDPHLNRKRGELWEGQSGQRLGTKYCSTDGDGMFVMICFFLSKRLISESSMKTHIY